MECQRNGCNNKLTRPTQKKYCSKSCAAKVNNIGVSRNKKDDNFCQDCGRKISKSATKCMSCNSKYYSDFGVFKDIPLSKITKPKKEHIRGNTNINRWRAITRNQVDRLIDKDSTNCMVCNYPYFIEACHVIPLRDIDNSILLEDALGFSNVVLLCPNCHKELDNSMVSITIEINIGV